MVVDAFFCYDMLQPMPRDDLTPSIVRERAIMAHITINQLMKSAGLPNSTFWRWERGDVNDPNPVTLQKILDALEDAERARAA